MAFNPTLTVNLGPTKTGLAATLRGQLYAADGTTTSGSPFSGWVALGANGYYGVSMPDLATHRGFLRVTDTGDSDIDEWTELNPEIGRVDATITSRSSHTAANVRTEIDSNSTQLAAIILLVDTVEASLSTLLSRISAPRAGYLDNISAGAVALSVDALAIKAKTNNLPASPAAVGSAMTLANGSIGAATIVDGAITAAKLAADALTAIRTGLATATSIADLQAILDKVNGMLQLDGSVYRFTANALELAPTGSDGGVGAGTGNVRVNETYGATESDPTPLRFVFGPGDAGVDNGWVRAFLQSEYDAGAREEKGETRTRSDGSFREDLMLDAGDYYLEYRLPDESKAVLLELTVEEA